MASRIIDDLSEEELIAFVTGAMDLLKSKFKSTIVENIVDNFELPRKTSRSAQSNLNVNRTQNTLLTPTPYASLDVEMDAQAAKDAPEPKGQSQAHLAGYLHVNTGKPNSSKVALIFLKDKEKWTTANRMITSTKINTTKCKLVSNGIQIDPAPKNDYCKLIKLLEKEKFQFFTYELKSERKLKVVLRGITQEISVENVKEDLLALGYPSEKIVRMNGKTENQHRWY
ncbi:hypothetical protein Trydic_g1812 [Trypoxylus dichotomus]